MLSRIRFAATSLAPEDFEEAWPPAAALAFEAPPSARPVRSTVTPMGHDLVSEPVHDGVGVEYFEDTDHLERFEAWLASPGAKAHHRALSAVCDVTASPIMVAEVVPLRGRPWLDTHWEGGGTAFKHLALARRAAGLSQETFSQRWRNHAGSLGTSPIPDRARGVAYVQHHPVPAPTADPAYDAVNEVYFDSLEGLRERIEWLAANLRPDATADLFRGSWFLAGTEQTVPGPW